MNDADLLKLANKTADLLTRATNIAEGCMVRMRDTHPGQPRAARYDGDSANEGPREEGDDGWRRNISDPTGNAAGQPDNGTHDRHELEKLTKAIAKDVELFVRCLERWPAAHLARPHERAKALHANKRLDPGCYACARIEQGAKVPYFSPVHGAPVELDDGAEEGEGTQIGLCHSCHNWWDMFGVLPPKAYNVALRDGDQRASRKLRSDAAAKMPKSAA